MKAYKGMRGIDILILNLQDQAVQEDKIVFTLTNHIVLTNTSLLMRI
jgi:hypothetical protein